MMDTVRLTILKAIKSLYEAATEFNPAPEGRRYYGLTFGTVEIGPLSDGDGRKRYSIGIVAGAEKKSALYPLNNCFLTVNVEFRATVNNGDPSPAIVAENVLGKVIQIMLDDENLGGLVIKHDETANEIDMVTYSDKSVQGMVAFEVHYRQSLASVYSQEPVA